MIYRFICYLIYVYLCVPVRVIFILFYLSLFLCVLIFCLHVYLCITCMPNTCGGQEKIGYPGTEVTEDCEPPFWWWKPNAGTLEELAGLLIAKLPLQSCLYQTDGHHMYAQCP